MFGSGVDEESWQDGFRDFMRNTRMVSESTIEEYIKYIGIVAIELGKKVEELAGNKEQLNETLRKIEDVAGWKRKMKGNYKTAINRLDAYFSSCGGSAGETVSCGGTSSQRASHVSQDHEGSNESHGEGVLKTARSETALLAQINEIERMAREHEDRTWNSVFKCVSAYALGMPSVVIALGLSMRGCLLAVLSAAFAFGGVAALIPVLQRPSRQLKEIQDYGERLHFENKQFGCIRPVEWTAKEKRSVTLSAIALLASVLFLGLAKVVGS